EPAGIVIFPLIRMGKIVSRKTGSPAFALRVEIALCSTRGRTVPVGTCRYFSGFAGAALALSFSGVVSFAVVCRCCAFTVFGPAFDTDLSDEVAEDCCAGGFANCAFARGRAKIAAVKIAIKMARLLMAYLAQHSTDARCLHSGCSARRPEVNLGAAGFLWI